MSQNQNVDAKICSHPQDAYLKRNRFIVHLLEILTHLHMLCYTVVTTILASHSIIYIWFGSNRETVMSYVSYDLFLQITFDVIVDVNFALEAH